MKYLIKWLVIIFMGINLQGCSFQPHISGFRPVYPELVFSFPGLIAWTEVDSLSPTLSWQSYPGEHQNIQGGEITPFIATDLGSIHDKQYDLKVWEAEDQISPTLAYEAQGLSQPLHTVRKTLKPSTMYFWSVRARFKINKINGQTRLSEWSLSQLPCPPAYGFKCARDFSRKMGYIPPQNYFRFITPTQ